MLIDKLSIATLVLEDGSLFKGRSISAGSQVIGEVVFNTAMTGYQEILTDPSYAQQIVVLTSPHIGNVGINADDAQSNGIKAAGLVVRELSPIVSSWQAEDSLQNYLLNHGVTVIEGVDTRRLTRILRETGAQYGTIVEGSFNVDVVLERLHSYKSTQNQHYLEQVSTTSVVEWDKNVYCWHNAGQKQCSHLVLEKSRYHVVVYDFGVKHHILRLLVHLGCRITLVPAEMPVNEVLKLKPNGVCLSNGPGDPSLYHTVINIVKRLLDQSIPLLGVCLGFQLIGLACGAKTIKMKLGHHGANHPIKDLESGRVFITSQNHGFVVDEYSLPSTLIPTHRSLFDDTLQGMRHRDKPVFALQGHPEASPGPQDIQTVFDHFLLLIKESSHYA